VGIGTGLFNENAQRFNFGAVGGRASTATPTHEHTVAIGQS